MIFDAIAIIVLCGINIVVGLILGAWLGGPAGALVGLALAVLIAAIEKWVADQVGWFEPSRLLRLLSRRQRFSEVQNRGAFVILQADERFEEMDGVVCQQELFDLSSWHTLTIHP